MAMAIAIPSSSDPRVGPGLQMTINGMTSAAAGHKLLVIVSDPSGAPTVTLGAAVIPGSSGQADVTLGILGPGYTSEEGFVHTNNVGRADGDSLQVQLYHFSSTMSLLESNNVSGRVWDATSWLTTLLWHMAKRFDTNDLILASVRKTFSTT